MIKDCYEKYPDPFVRVVNEDEVNAKEGVQDGGDSVVAAEV